MRHMGRGFRNRLLSGLIAGVATLCAITGTAAPRTGWMDISAVRPSQLTIGLAESKIRARALEQMTAAERQGYLDDHPVSVVYGPGRALHLVDGHHLSWALVDLASRGIMEPKAPAKVLADLSGTREEEFWRTMKERHWLWLYDASDNPIHPSDLPPRIQDMKDDRHRSLAWLLREEGCFEDLDQPFQEFYWARFLRKNVRMPDNRAETITSALLAAKAIAHGDGPAALPGYIKQHSQIPHGEIGKKNRRRIDSLESATGRR